ncbi:MAG: dihydrofolate reductase family protein, partial [Pseudomonadales bacterium]|nr:dihydrofolate reductase family protein [Pseudomonadales bacterium]
SDMVTVEKLSVERVNEIRQNAKSDIYLCGGGQFAGWLLDNGLIDELKIKLNPIVLGGGTKIFGTSKSSVNWDLTEKQSFPDGLQILTFTKKN